MCALAAAAIGVMNQILLVFVVIAFTCGSGIYTQLPERQLKIAVLDFGDSSTARLTSEKLTLNLKSVDGLVVMDHDQGRAAARGMSYSGSLNMSLEESRDLGAAIGCDFFITGDAQTSRRSPSTGEIYFESYASLFLVSSRSGRLVLWERQRFRGPTAEAAGRLLLAAVSSAETAHRYGMSLRRAERDEREKRELSFEKQTPIIEEAPDEDRAAANGLQLPRPYRRLRPAYPDSAAQAEVEATVDLLVDLDAAGEVGGIEVARWAGYGLDEAAIETVRRLHFFPAMRNGSAIPLRVLLRYNFRKPPK